MKKRSTINNKKAQFQLSFGMIFSIILIILFIVFAFYAVRYFLGFQEDIQKKQFVNNLKNDIDTAQRATSISQEREYSLPRDIVKVCFTDSVSQNLEIYQNFFPESEHIDGIVIDQEDLEDNKLCFENIGGKINILIQKSFGEEYVQIKRP